ncbi:MAG: GtrA family protein [Spirochaetales bacterium]|nr:GtrA family protein [Spirochaetales bacterium]
MKKVDLKAEFWTAVKYGLVGVLNTLVFAGVTLALSRLKIHYSIYTGVGYIIAITFSFIMNLKFTFSRFPGKILPRALKFIGVSISLMLIVQGIQFITIEKLNLPELAGVLTGMVFYTGTGFLINRLWVFKSKETDNDIIKK